MSTASPTIGSPVGVSPRCVGRPVDRSLEERWTALPEWKVRSLCSTQTLTEALLATVPVLYRGAVSVSTANPRYTDIGFIAPFPGAAPGHDDRADRDGEAGRLWVLSFAEGAENRWRYLSLTLRADLIAEILRDSAPATQTVTDLLSTPRTHAHPVWRSLALDAWWDTRLAEGHTPETAEFLLALLLPPGEQVTYDTDTQRPRLP